MYDIIEQAKDGYVPANGPKRTHYKGMNMPEPIQTKSYSRCKKILPPAEFFPRETRCKSCNAARCAKYRRTKRGKAMIARYRASEKGKAIQKAGFERYRKSEHGKAKRRAYRMSEHGRAVRNTTASLWAKTEKGKAKRKRANDKNRVTGKSRAHDAVKYAVRKGRLPHISTCKCKDCGQQAKLYHHHKGYAKEHRLDVVPMCQKCDWKSHNLTF